MHGKKKANFSLRLPSEGNDVQRGLGRNYDLVFNIHLFYLEELHREVEGETKRDLLSADFTPQWVPMARAGLI